MWEAIASNRRRSFWLICLIGALLVLLGAVIGLAIAMLAGGRPHFYHVTPDLGPQAPFTLPAFWDQVVAAQAGAYFGISAAVLIWMLLWATAAGAGDDILLRTAKAREIRKADAPQLWNIVEEMTIAAGLSRMPRVFILDEAGLNAFAVGYRPDKAAIAVTAGLLKRLTRDELQGVVAHELGHIRNQDVRFMTLAGVMVGAVVLLSEVFLRGMFHGAGRSRSSSKGGGGAALIMLAIALVVAIVAPLAAQLLYFACSRRREFLADASAVQFTRYPEGLASALERIARQAGEMKDVHKVVAPLCIVNPREAAALVRVFATHPPTAQRVLVLRSMAGAGLAAYEAAYRKLHRGAGHCLAESTLRDAAALPIRAPTPEPQTKQAAVRRAQAVGELLDRVLPLVVIGCPCGVRLKLPPDFKRESLTCPRCGRQHPVPRAAVATSAAAGGAGPLSYRRQGTGWESFQCGCGHPIQLSPQFSAPMVTCTRCKRRVQIVPASQA